MARQFSLERAAHNGVVAFAPARDERKKSDDVSARPEPPRHLLKGDGAYHLHSGKTHSTDPHSRQVCSRSRAYLGRAPAP